MAADAKVTTDHRIIRKWVDERGGSPANIKIIEDNREQTDLLSIDFPGYNSKDNLKKISWKTFFEKFEKNNLAFFYRDESKSGEESRFFKIIKRESNISQEFFM